MKWWLSITRSPSPATFTQQLHRVYTEVYTDQRWPNKEMFVSTQCNTEMWVTLPRPATQFKEHWMQSKSMPRHLKDDLRRYLSSFGNNRSLEPARIFPVRIILAAVIPIQVLLLVIKLNDCSSTRSIIYSNIILCPTILFL